VRDVGVAALALLVAVVVGGDLVGPLDQPHVDLGMRRPDGLDQWFEDRVHGHPPLGAEAREPTAHAHAGGRTGTGFRGRLPPRPLFRGPLGLLGRRGGRGARGTGLVLRRPVQDRLGRFHLALHGHPSRGCPGGRRGGGSPARPAARRPVRARTAHLVPTHLRRWSMPASLMPGSCGIAACQGLRAGRVRGAGQAAVSAETSTSVSFPRPLRNPSSSRAENPTTVPPALRTRSTAARPVPPVARTSSTMSTRSPGAIASTCISTVAVPYSR